MLDRETRRLVHDKGSRIKNVNSPPTRGEGKDGDMQIYNGHLYIKDKFIWHHFIPKSGFKVNKLTDDTGGTASETLIDAAGGTYPTDEEFVNAVASLSAKINKIIELLQLDIK